MTTPAIEGVILDVDGTLVDSNDAHARAWVDALAEAKIAVAFERVRPLIGMGGDKLLPEVSGISEDDPRGAAISKRRSEIFKTRYLPVVRPFRGARELLEKMRDAGLVLAVASSAKGAELGPLLKLVGGEHLVDTKTSSSDADHSKPDPDIVTAALKKAKLAPERAVMLGDTPYDVASAKRAGVRCVAVRCGGWDDAGLRDAVAVYDGVWEILARFDETPFARR